MMPYYIITNSKITKVSLLQSLIELDYSETTEIFELLGSAFIITVKWIRYWLPKLLK